MVDRRKRVMALAPCSQPAGLGEWLEALAGANLQGCFASDFTSFVATSPAFICMKLDVTTIEGVPTAG